ncbi:MAG: Bax inhibitor-1/YccA family protein [Proteobacteria bacterium]|nr:Bax inhibitor-1/YccA family protein [Pseudomonadota bacterium]
MKTSNPAMKQFEKQAMSLGPVDELIVDDSQRMTVDGTINKTGILLLIVTAVAAWAWQTTLTNPALGRTLMFTGMFGGLALGFVIAFKPKFAPTGSIIYAGLIGLFVGGISAIFEAKYPGLVFQAVGLTLAVFFSMLFSYKTGLIKVTETFKKVVIFATMGIAVFYLISLVASFGFGANISYFNTENASLMSIGLSLFIVGIASLNLVLDFDFIERGSESNMPKYYEWYGAFGLVVTIVWLYIELLRLLAKLRD